MDNRFQALDEELIERFDATIDREYPSYHILGTTIRPSRALKDCDPAAYLEAYHEWLDKCEED